MRPRIIPESAYLTSILVMGLVVAAALVQAALERMVGTLPPFIIFYPTVAVVAMLLGGRAGVLATCLAALVVDYWFIPPIYGLKIAGDHAVALGLFIAGGLVMSAMATMVNQARRSAAAAAERARVAEQLRESEQRLLMAKEAANLAIFDSDLVSNTIRWDSRLWEFWGLAAEEPVTLEAFLAGIHPEDRAAVCAAAENAKDPTSDGIFMAEHRVLGRKDGRERWVAAAGQVYFKQGKAVRLIGTVQDITQRKRAEEALRESEARFSTAFAASPDAMVISRIQDGLIREVNGNGTRLFGRGRHEMIGKHSIDLGIYLDPAHRAEAVAILNKDGRVLDHELLIRRPSGEVRRTLLSAEPVEIAGEDLVLSVIRDITEQRQAELDQDLAAELLRMVNRGGDDLHGLIGQILHLIRERTGFDAVGLRLRQGEDCPYYQQDGFSDEFLREENFLCAKGADGSIRRDAAGQPVLECTCGVVLSGRADPTMPCFTEGGSFWTNRSTELLALAPEADPRENPRNRCIHAGYQSVALIPVRANERILGLLQLNDRRPDRFTPERIRCFESLCSHLGLTLQRRQAEEALQAVSAELQRTLDIAATGLIHCSRDLRYLSVNPAYARMLGLSQEQMVGRPIVEVLGPAAFEVIRPYVERVLRGERFQYEVDLPLPGGIKPIHVAYVPDQDSSGNVVGWVASITDIAERRRAEQELLAAKRAAEQANAAKDHFLAVLSHELRTPLTPVLPALEEMAAQVPEEAREDLEMARRNVELEARLIDDLLDVTRISRGKIELHRESVELGTVIQHAAEVCAADIEARQLHFGIEIEDGPYPVEADPARLQQVFWNLLKNAIKFTPHDGCVGIRCHSRDGYVVAEVKDSGIGIEPEALSRIFNAFEQVDRAVTRQFGGLGLGLAISKALVEMHGGTIQAQSKGKGRGAIFTVRLPIHRAEAGAVRPEPGQSAPAAQAPATARPLQILLVEDHGDTARIMRRMLQAKGHQVEAAGDVATALELAQERSFDLLLSDLGLPDRSGLELMQELREHGRTLPGIALSGFGQEEDIRRSHEAGFAEHLTKPVNLGQLEAAIGRVAR